MLLSIVAAGAAPQGGVEAAYVLLGPQGQWDEQSYVTRYSALPSNSTERSSPCRSKRARMLG
jgi:hypothetical protein